VLTEEQLDSVAAAVAYEQYEWRTSGTADGLREAIEKMF